jgi:small-conductance mechanosensitive channel
VASLPVPPFNIQLPEAFYRPLGELTVWQWLGVPVVLVGALLVAWLIQGLALAALQKLTKLTQVTWDDQLVAGARGPVFLLLFAGAVVTGMAALSLPGPAQDGFVHLGRSCVIIAVARLLLSVLAVGAEFVERSMGEGPQTLARLRGVQTQVAVLRRVAEAIVWVVACALLLTQFDAVRAVGVSLLASAGLAGLVLGLAAQKSLATLLAGLQLSLTQPIRLGDQVMVEGEFGEVEEIGLTYVVVKIWDLRRLVVPITYFLDRTFQNWSKGVDQILGTFTLQVDYTADVGAFRAELSKLLATDGKPLWDGKVQSVQVTDTSDRTQTLRVLISASTPGASWDLRCLLRERMIGFLQNHSAWLPRVRSENQERAVVPVSPVTPPLPEPRP